MHKKILAAGAATALSLSLVACSSSDNASSAIDIQDAYVKSASMEPTQMDMGSDKAMDMPMEDMEMEPMSAAFMTITNTTGEEVRLTGGSTNASTTVEIHEVVDGTMRPIDGGLVIAAGDTSTLKPGGNHVMLMGLTRDLEAGDEVELTLTFSDGESLKVMAPVKDVASGDEPYATSTPMA